MIQFLTDIDYMNYIYNFLSNFVDSNNVFNQLNTYEVNSKEDVIYYNFLSHENNVLTNSLLLDEFGAKEYMRKDVPMLITARGANALSTGESVFNSLNSYKTRNSFKGDGIGILRCDSYLIVNDVIQAQQAQPLVRMTLRANYFTRVSNDDIEYVKTIQYNLKDHLEVVN